MSHRKIEERVDIYQFPTTITPANENDELTMGDLHGNAMKLMFMLVKQGVASINESDYKELVRIYRIPVDELTKKDINQFDKILDNIPYNKATIRLIGDELADRGSNDYFTLKILQKLQKRQIPVEIIISNHSIEFLQACEEYQTRKHFSPSMLQGDHACSLRNLNTLITKGLVSADEVLDIAQEAYKPNLKAIASSLHENNSGITIYSHAGIGLNTVKDLAKQFKVSYQDDSAVHLARTIDNINEKFRTHVTNGTVMKQCPDNAMWEGYFNSSADLRNTPLVFTMWNRRYDLIKRPAQKKNYNLIYVHGHDPEDPENKKQNIHNLDENNDLGKADDWNNKYGDKKDYNKGKYIVLYNVRMPNTALKQSTESSQTQLMHSLKMQLQNIQEKIEPLRAKGHEAAANAAEKLYNTINESINAKDNPNQFKIKCKIAIQIARQKLEKHRGWGRILSYLAATITGIGALAVIADITYQSATGKHLSIFKTDTARKLSVLEETIDEIPNTDVGLKR